jgi:hyperosmotically inducible protein
MNNKRVSLMVAAASCVMAAGAAFADGASSVKSDQPVKDSYITTKVKAELTKDSATKARDIKVVTKDGVVSLSGSVESAMEKSKAEQDARGIKGVLDVTNGLTVK